MSEDETAEKNQRESSMLSPSTSYGPHSGRSSPQPPRHGHQHSARSSPRPSGHGSNTPHRKQGLQSSELVPYNSNQGLDNDGLDEDDQFEYTGNDQWERISADSISL